MDDNDGPHFFVLTAVTLADDDDGIDLVEDETNAAADLVAAWLSLLRRSKNDAAMITAGMKRIDAIAPPCESALLRC